MFQKSLVVISVHLV